MKLIRKNQRISEDEIRHTVVIESGPCSANREGLAEKHLVLGMVANQPELTRCGLVPFAKMIMVHNGANWIIECEAIEHLEKDTPNGSQRMGP